MTKFFVYARKMFLMTGSKGFVPYFYNHNKNLYNKFEFFKKSLYLCFSKLYWNHTRIVRNPKHKFLIKHFTDTYVVRV